MSRSPQDITHFLEPPPEKITCFRLDQTEKAPTGFVGRILRHGPPDALEEAPEAPEAPLSKPMAPWPHGPMAAEGHCCRCMKWHPLSCIPHSHDPRASGAHCPANHGSETLEISRVCGMLMRETLEMSWDLVSFRGMS